MDRPRLAIASNGAVQDIPDGLADELIRDNPEIRQEWTKWRAMSGGHGRLILIQLELVAEIAGRMPGTSG